jgi:gluconate kinase
MAWPALRLVYLRVDREELHRRLAARLEHFFPARLLDSQLQDLEAPQADEEAIVGSGDVDTVVRSLVPLLRQSAAVPDRREE